MRSIVLTLMLLFSGQQLPLGGIPVAAGGGGFAYTGQNCTGGGTSSGLISVCSATLNVSLGDEIVVFGTIGTSSTTVLSCALALGTGTVTWTVVTGITATNTGNGETLGACIGQVTGAGTVEPQINWLNIGSDNSIVAAAFSGSSSHAQDTATSTNDNTGSTAANGVLSGSITTTQNGDLLVGGTADVSGASATINAGTTSVTYTKIACTTAWGGQTCLQWGQQTTAAAGTQANWTYSLADQNMTGVVAVKN